MFTLIILITSRSEEIFLLKDVLKDALKTAVKAGNTFTVRRLIPYSRYRYSSMFIYVYLCLSKLRERTQENKQSLVLNYLR